MWGPYSRNPYSRPFVFGTNVIIISHSASLPMSGINPSIVAGESVFVEAPLGLGYIIKAGDPSLAFGFAATVVVTNLPEMEFSGWNPLVTITDVDDADIYVAGAPRVKAHPHDPTVEFGKDASIQASLGEWELKPLHPTVVGLSGLEIHPIGPWGWIPHVNMWGFHPTVEIGRNVSITPTSGKLRMSGRLPFMHGQRPVSLTVENIPTMWMKETEEGQDVSLVKNIEIVSKPSLMFMLPLSPILDFKLAPGRVRIAYFPNRRLSLQITQFLHPPIFLTAGSGSVIDLDEELEEIATLTAEGLEPRVALAVTPDSPVLGMEGLTPTVEAVAYPRQFRRDKIKGRLRQGVIT